MQNLISFKFQTASKDGLICIWSSIEGKILNTLNTQFTLADILVASNGSRIIARFSDSTDFPIMSLNNKPVVNLDNKVISHVNIKSSKIYNLKTLENKH